LGERFEQLEWLLAETSQGERLGICLDYLPRDGCRVRVRLRTTGDMRDDGGV
jgi:hypothetical protein